MDSIFRPRILANGIFAINTGYGVSFTLAGIDSEGLDRQTLDLVSKQIADRQPRCCRDDCQLLRIPDYGEERRLPGAADRKKSFVGKRHERAEFLKDNAKFKSVRLIVTLYMPGKVAEERRGVRGEVAIRSAQNSERRAAV